MTHHVDAIERAQMQALRDSGYSYADIAEAFDRATQTVYLNLNPDKAEAQRKAERRPPRGLLVCEGMRLWALRSFEAVQATTAYLAEGEA